MMTRREISKILSNGCTTPPRRKGVENMDVKSILVVGDSLSKGVIFDSIKKRYCFAKDGFVSTMQKLLIPKIYNTAKFGATIAYGETLLVPKMRELEPEVVLIEFGGNDCDFDWEAIAKNPFLDHQPKTGYAEFVRRLTEMVVQVQEFGKTPLLMTLPPLNAPSYFNWFTGGDAEKGASILKWLGDVTRIYWWHERYSCAIERVARQTGANLIDVRSEFLAQEDFREYLCVDGIHPNHEGHHLIAGSIREFIQNKQASDLLVPEICLA